VSRDPFFSYVVYFAASYVFMLFRFKFGKLENEKFVETTATRTRCQTLHITCLSCSCFWRHRMFYTLFGLVLRRCDTQSRNDPCQRRAHCEHAVCSQLQWTVDQCACADTVTGVWCSKHCPNVGGHKGYSDG